MITKWRRVAIIAGWSLAACLPQAGAWQEAKAEAGRKADAPRALDVVVGPEDTVTIAALDADEISKPWRVSSSGELNLPLLGRIQAGGMTVRDLEREIATRMKKYYHNPQVTVFVSEFRSQPVSITGQVARPGVIQLAGSKTLFDVLVLAGGPTKEAGETVTLTRRLSTGTIPHPMSKKDPTGRFHVLELPVKEAMNGESDGAHLKIAPNDVVHVSEVKQQKLVHISGAVARPGSVELVTQDSVSILKVVAMAGGLTQTAKKKAVIMHINADGTQTAMSEVDLSRIMKGKVRDIELMSGDIVVIPNSTLSTYLSTATNSAITSSLFLIGRL